MILLPDDQWRWCYDEGRDKLLLDLTDEMQFETAYQAKQLSPSARQSHPFSLEDASYYFHLLECIGELPFSEPERVQLVLNAIAFCRFGKPMMPQSWYFKEVGLQQQPPLLGEVFSLIAEQGHGDFLVIEPGDKASVCLFLGDRLPVAEDKCLRQSSVIKVMNNRLVPFHAVSRALMQLA